MRQYHVDGTLPPVDTFTMFVFGSNLAGIHGAGAARVAREQFGAIQGTGAGPQGFAYAIPTKDHDLGVLSLDVIRGYVEEFLVYAKLRPEMTFFVTAVGCGFAGYKPTDIAPMFQEAPESCNLPDVWRDVLGP